jgi:hypothetical protein
MNEKAGINISGNCVAAILLAFFFLVPVHFYILGEGYGYGIQGLTYRYQITPQGDSFIPLSYDAGYVLNQTLTGKTAYSIIAWIIAVILYTVGMLLFLVSYDEKPSKKFRISAWLIIGSLVILILSCIIQYGLLFNGPAGISILFGLPFLFFTGWSIHGLSTPRRQELQ